MDNQRVEKQFDSLADIVATKESWSIKARVLRFWKIPTFLNPRETSSIDMVLLDESTNYPYKLIFQMKTKVQVSKSSSISSYGLTLTNVSEVLSHSVDFEFLLTGISAEREYLRDGKITKMVVIELTDDSGKCECALFGDDVDYLNKLTRKNVVFDDPN
ncbi:replication factor A protein [Trifolium medium]|uniref:Replication factor A protein n=1 Tax=Trifolium medium TaxID=97028 RepID=A0A392MY45_9FABA|nr:replication factor A protein [Trifolium medium]